MESRRGLEKIPSSGGLSEGLSKQEFFEGFSVPHNKEQMRIFNDLELVEQLGSGIPRILGHYGKESFSFFDNFLRMTFAVQKDTNETSVKVDDAEDNQKGGVMGGLKGGQIGGLKDAVINDIKKFTHRQKEVLKLIASNSRISRSAIAEVLHINESGIQKHLNNLKGTGFIERVGSTRGYWEINL